MSTSRPGANGTFGRTQRSNVPFTLLGCTHRRSDQAKDADSTTHPDTPRP
jgi:hypothetical protein